MLRIELNVCPAWHSIPELNSTGPSIQFLNGGLNLAAIQNHSRYSRSIVPPDALSALPWVDESPFELGSG